jgi:EmrB/QacA subfamily drug resistance transporter
MIPYPRRWQALVVLCLALALINMDNLIVNVALPTLVRDLHATSSQLQWIVDAYILVFACALLSMGSLGDRFGRRRALYAGLLLFGAGSVLAAVAGAAGPLIAARSITGLGAALICPATLSIITNIFPDSERGKAIGVWASFAVLGILVGPTAGGWLLDRYWWGSVFLINLPIVVVVIVAVAVVVPDSRDPDATPLDPPGAALATAGLVSLVYAIIEAPHRGWTDPLVLGGFAAATLLLAAFVSWERRRRHPMLPVALFRDPRFTAASAALTLMFFATNGLLFLLTQHLQFVLEFSPLRAGVGVLPVATLLLSGPIAPQLARRVGAAPVVSAGLLIQAAAGLLLFGVSVEDGYRPVGVALAVFGFGLGLSMAPATESIMSALPLAKAGVGSAMNDTTRAVGGALGVAVLGSVLSARYASAIAPALSGLPAPAAATARDSIGAAAHTADQLGTDGPRLAAAARQAFITGTHTSLIVAIAALVAGAILAAVLLPPRRTSPAETEQTQREPLDAEGVPAH